jgi:hypothetical protein
MAARSYDIITIGRRDCRVHIGKSDLMPDGIVSDKAIYRQLSGKSQGRSRWI